LLLVLIGGAFADPFVNDLVSPPRHVS